MSDAAMTDATPSAPTAATWDPTQYLAFAGHRLRPALELLGRVPVQSPQRVVDLGCGAGNVTAYLRRRWPQAALVGVDSSAEMLATAAEAQPGIAWVRADVATWVPDAPPDVIYANASLHWVEDHATLFSRLVGLLGAGGALAVQMPRNFDQPSHTLMHDAAAAGPWAARLAGLQRAVPVREPAFYYDRLAPHCKVVDLWETRYVQVLSGENPVAEFTKGSWLKPLLDALAEPERSAFEADYRRRVRAAYPPRPDGTTLFPFTRLFIVATR
jgi:trans-aconitate 2-methyltransferase